MYGLNLAYITAGVYFLPRLPVVVSAAQRRQAWQWRQILGRRTRRTSRSSCLSLRNGLIVDRRDLGRVHRCCCCCCWNPPSGHRGRQHITRPVGVTTDRWMLSSTASWLTDRWWQHLIWRQQIHGRWRRSTEGTKMLKFHWFDRLWICCIAARNVFLRFNSPHVVFNVFARFIMKIVSINVTQSHILMIYCVVCCVFLRFNHTCKQVGNAAW